MHTVSSMEMNIYRFVYHGIWQDTYSLLCRFASLKAEVSVLNLNMRMVKRRTVFLLRDTCDFIKKNDNFISISEKMTFFNV